MSEIVRCKRCNRILKNKLSIDRGFGETCYRIFKLQETKLEINPEINTEIDFLKMEIKMLKRMIKNIQVNNAVIPIERIKQNRPEQKISGNQNNYGKVMIEMKDVFNKMKNGYKHLKSINPIEMPIEPPIQVLI